MHSIGVVLSLLAAVQWAISPLCWSSAGRQIGSVGVNVLRMLMASIVLLILLAIWAAVRGGLHPAPTWSGAGWLVLSGLVGLVICDGLYFEAIVRLGARRAIQVFTLSPVASVILGWAWLGETLNRSAIVGIAIVLASVSYIASAESRADNPREPGRMSPLGLILAILAATAGGAAAVLARRTLRVEPMDDMAATVIRVVSACPLVFLMGLAKGQHPRRLIGHLRTGRVLSRIILGTLLGPVGGMVCYIMALGRLDAAVVSTLIATSPLFVLPIVVVRYRAKIRLPVYVATVTAIVGVALIAGLIG